jgi:hypothetical protein
MIRLLAKGKDRGYVTYDEILKEFPTVEDDIIFLDELYEKLSASGIDILEGGGLLESNSNDDLIGKKYSYGRGGESSYDSIQMYLKEIGQYQLISGGQEKELAKRIVDDKQSILSISVKVYGNPKYLVTVPRKLFRPMPNVDSAVLIIDKISKNFFKNPEIDEKLFFEILKAGFAHKRKILIKNLESKISKIKLDKIWESENFPKDVRAENLSPEMWKKNRRK